MKKPTFNNDGHDKITFAPFELQNCLDSEWKDVRLSFSAWDWFQEKYGTDTIDDYYFNGYGVQGLVMAVRLNAGIKLDSDSVDYNSEGDTCYIHFNDISEAITTASLCSEMIKDQALIKKFIKVARDNDLEDS